MRDKLNGFAECTNGCSKVDSMFVLSIALAYLKLSGFNIPEYVENPEAFR